MKYAAAVFIFLIFLDVGLFFLLYQKKSLVGNSISLSSTAPLHGEISESTDAVAEESKVAPTASSPSQPLPSPLQLPTPSPKPITLLFGGDLMFDRNIRTKTQSLGYDYPLKDLAPLFAQYDQVIANLEGSITSFPSKSVGSAPGSSANFYFTFPVQIAQTLRDQHVSIVNLGNNHIFNFGKDGVLQTKQNLDTAQIKHFGDTSVETTSEERVIIITQQGIKIAFINYNQFINNGLPHALEDLKYAKKNADLSIVFTHWGVEYAPTANASITGTAHQFINDGADLIIGMHPHVIQNTETYKGKKIYYSLGNLVFDQYFSPETQKGLLVEVTIDPVTKAFQFKEFGVTLKTDGRTELDRAILLPSK